MSKNKKSIADSVHLLSKALIEGKGPRWLVFLLAAILALFMCLAVASIPIAIILIRR